MLNEKQRAEIKDRCEKATKGPWRRQKNDINTATLSPKKIVNGTPYERLAQVYHRVHFEDENDKDVRDGIIADADFIANSRTDIPALLATIEELQRRIEGMEAALRKVSKLRSNQSDEQIQRGIESGEFYQGTMASYGQACNRAADIADKALTQSAGGGE